jgi:hypothetical protein
MPRQLVAEVLLGLWMLKRGRHSLINFEPTFFDFCALPTLYHRRVARVAPACRKGVVRAVDAGERQALFYKL